MGKNWIIAIGINEYKSNVFSNLTCAKNDAEKMADFCNKAKFDKVFIFTESDQTTNQYLRKFLEDTVQTVKLGIGDNLWFFFAGHGVRYEHKDYLVFSDSLDDNIQDTYVSVEFVTEKLRCSGADNVVLFLDACRTKPRFANRGFGGDIEKGVITFYACNVDQQSMESSALQHGLFSYVILEFFREYSDSKTDDATVKNLHQYLEQEVPKIIKEYGVIDNPQNPILHVEPEYKKWFNLLNNQGVPLEHIEPEKEKAYSQEKQENFDKAVEQWKYVDLASRGLSIDAKAALERIEQNKSKIDQGRRNFLIYSFGGSISLLAAFFAPKKIVSQPINPPSQPINPPTFQFETVTVNKTGKIVKRNNNQAKFFKEDLGNGITLEMVEIPAGSFIMGSPESEKGRRERESPQHEVNVSAFSMGKFAVTQEQYQQIMGKNPSRFKGDGSTSLTNQRPVEQVSWNDAVEFCTKLSERTGRKYRLPSEAEWEYACRAGTTTPFYFGETISTDLANYRGTDWEYKGKVYSGNYGQGQKGEFRAKTTEVGIFPPNAFGLYDMHGNVWEWCQDDLHENYINAPNNGSVWTSQNGKNKLLRGGSWVSYPKTCRSAYRLSLNRDDLGYVIGFRVVCVVGRIL